MIEVIGVKKDNGNIHQKALINLESCKDLYTL